MKGQPKAASVDSLARQLRIGLLGSPYDWSSLDFEKFNQQNISFVFTTFPGTREGLQQDLLLSTVTDSKKQSLHITQDEQRTLTCELPVSVRTAISSPWIVDSYTTAISQFNNEILIGLHDHNDHYLDTESIIARYGIQVLRVGDLLNHRQIHIENEALSYLIQTPWRNEHELDYQIARMVFYLEGDVLRKNYVQRTVYEFGTSTRGISNAHVVRHLIQSFTYDVIAQFDFRTASNLFDVRLAPTEIPFPTWEVPEQRRKAA